MRAVFMCCLLVACGDNGVTPDALAVDAIDAAPDAPTPPVGCDWGELHDDTNHTAPETTPVAFGTKAVYCGQIDIGHTVSTTMLVDADAFGFAIGADTSIRIELEGDFGPLGVELSIVNRFGDPIRTSRFVGAHAVTAARLSPGGYGLAVRAIGAEPAAAIPYKATITIDTSSCHVTSAATYTESGAANDMVDVRFTGDVAMRRVLTAAADAPEPDGVTFAPGTQVRFTGTSADVDAADDYRDRDAFLVVTGAGVDTLSVRLDWASTSADLDFFVFPASVPELVGASHVSTMAPEAATFAVAPSTTYWLWIGAYDTSTGLPITYDASVCAE